MLGSRAYDIAVVGGGLVGAATAYGLARSGVRLTVLDEGDIAFRASRGNFALVWVQAKGLGMAEYAGWTKASSDRWATLAAILRDDTGIDVSHHRPGGFTLCLSPEELEGRMEAMRRLHNQPDMVKYPYEILDHEETKRRLPAIGPEVVGSVYCPLDGHVNSLRLFRALHVALKKLGVDYRSNAAVETIRPEAGGFVVQGPWGGVSVGKVVLAAGLGNARLAPMVGLKAPVLPSKGQIVVTERAAPFLDYPIATVRQTDEGSVMIGDSQEDLGFDTVVSSSVISLMAQRAVRMFPAIANLNVLRTWSALRVMSPDGFPIYDQSVIFPGAFVVTCHSGVTLAANHVLSLANDILTGSLPEELAPFRSRRFDVPAAA
jgi:glycine/D-amino acid oxidase-like deaminating enzyme